MIKRFWSNQVVPAMNTFRMMLLLLTPFCAFATSPEGPENAPQNATAFMTTSDRLSSTLSSLSVKNVSGATTYNITSLYVSGLTSNPNDCTTSTVLDSFANPFGALWAPQVSIAPGETKTIGANFLYNMIMRALYNAFAEGLIPLSTPGNGPDAGNNTWCLYLGVTNQTMGTNSLTCTQCTLEAGNILVPFNRPAIENRNITCNDATRTCTAAASSQQTIG